MYIIINMYIEFDVFVKQSQTVRLQYRGAASSLKTHIHKIEYIYIYIYVCEYTYSFKNNYADSFFIWESQGCVHPEYSRVK